MGACPVLDSFGVYVRGEANRLAGRQAKPLPANVHRSGSARTRSGRLTQAYCVPCPSCGRERIVKRRNHAVAHAALPCKQCSERAPAEIYRGFRMSWFRKYEYQAMARDVAWGITTDEAIEAFELQGGRCVLTGEPLTTNGNFTAITASLDRIDNQRGYEKDNIQWIHKALNLMRGDMPIEDFVDACRRVAAHSYTVAANG